ncbi:MAG TPA: TIGR00725 family protein [Coriobacteriia bacterium]
MLTVIGVMGGAVVSDEALENAQRLGRLVAERGWVLLNGGRNAGVMAASARGASEAGGLVVGILPGDNTTGVAPGVDIAIPTGMGDARNAINVLASRVVVALPGGPGTVSEVALALKAGRDVVLLGFPLGVPFAPYYERGQLVDATTAEEAIECVEMFLAESEGL